VPGWLIAVFVAFLLLFIVALIFAVHGAGSAKESSGPPPVSSPFSPPPISLPQVNRAQINPPPISWPTASPPPVAAPPKFRRRPPATFRRKEVRGNEPMAVPKINVPPAEANHNGGKIRTATVKVNFDAICRKTGRVMRICRCIKCENERAKNGV
jgi:hypothetical protein